MDDRTLEREIESLLAAEPSHDFTATVRQRIAMAPPRGLGPVPAGFAWAGATAVVAIALAALVLRVDRRPAPERELSAQPVAIDASHAPVTVHGSRPRVPAPPVRVAPAGERRASVRVEPEVVIDPREAAAWRRLLAGTGAGAVTLSFATVSAGSIETPAPAGEEFAIPLIVIEPLAPLREQGVPK
jgi:hypothetical protein